MAIRIPGRQPTAGLESFFLNESPAWLPTQRESALVVLGAASGVSEGLANGGTAPLGGALSDTGTIDSEQAYLAGALEDQANRAVSDAGSVNNLRGDGGLKERHRGVRDLRVFRAQGNPFFDDDADVREDGFEVHNYAPICVTPAPADSGPGCGSSFARGGAGVTFVLT